MAVSTRHVLEQGPVLGSLARTILSGVQQKISGGDASKGSFQTPGPEIRETLPARSAELIRDYARHVGGEPSAYKRTVPPHLFPQWVFPLQARSLAGAPYPLEKVLNGGCRMEMKAPIPQGEAMKTTGQLVRIDDNGARAVLHMRAVTGTASQPECLITDLQAVVPLGGGDKSKPKKKKEKPRVPEFAKERQRWRIPADAGLDFAKLTGDFNPIHWIPPYARMSGFPNTILHGFSTLARAYEGVVKTVHSGNVNAIETFTVRFTRPLVLPKTVGLYTAGHDIYVGDAPGGPAYLVGSYEPRG